ncbi:ASCH domain-containing protein [Enterococcus sp. LJL90]
MGLDFVRSEGERDLSYEHWYRVHEEFFTVQFKGRDLIFSTEANLVCENFRVVDIYQEKC